jgi:carbamoyl-phosphate synthase small subunit
VKAYIALEDGTIFRGRAFGASGSTQGEVVFNTSLSGYQEILTDPSYQGQIVAMTYPLIGNYGVNPEDVEARGPWVEGFIVKECSQVASNWRSHQNLDEYLKEYNIMGVEGVDTRALTRHIRLQGSMKAVMSTEITDEKKLAKMAKDSESLEGKDLVREVTCDKAFEWSQRKANKKKYQVVVIDCGVKYNILRKLEEQDFKVTVVPAAASFQDIMALKPDGLMLSNGPGDPMGAPYVVETVKQFLGKIPIFGICFGHQMLGLAMGGKTYKLKFGHHGGNHPVKDLHTGAIAITVQNHCFCVDLDSLPQGKDLEITHINLNDQTLEGIRHKKWPLFSVQFHPEASPGPHDATYLFQNFKQMITEFTK